ncbi:esterase/lipase family protein [Haliangium sp.]|uniref:esterase/lipase family protein n=1 Tax=Haliangium sp. TaxID=2663208 RepID=UPI003D13BC61
MANRYPVVLVHGMFGWGPSELGGFPYWGMGVVVPCPMKRLLASVGPISSAHDRACELAYQLKGGQVDYGAEHAATAGHERYGKTYDQGLYPIWSDDDPVHLVGHSMGGPTVWMLQHLLDIDYFGWGSNANWVRSISVISGAMNGSTVVYFLGLNERTGLLEDDSVGGYLVSALELYTAATGTLFDAFYDFDLDHWGFVRGPDEGLGDYLARISHSPMFRGTDNGAYGVSLQGMYEQNALCSTHPKTHYFSYVTEQTFEGFLTGYHRPEPRMNPFIIPTSVYIGQKRFDEPPYPGFEAEPWWPNDGLISTFSQQYPRSAGAHVGVEGISARCEYEPGVWHYETLEGVDHIDIVALPQFDQIGFQKRFYTGLYNRLAAL